MRSLPLLLLFSFGLMLSACSVETLYGINTQEWNKMSEKQKKKVQDGYAKVQNTLLHEDRYKSNYETPVLNVVVYGGWIMMPPFDKHYRYEKVNISLAEGQCTKTTVRQEGGEKVLPLKICYTDEFLQIDPSPYDPDKMHGSIVMHASPLWLRGYTYKHINSTGYAKLKNAHVRVQALL